MQTLLIDGDIILYSVAFSMETPVYVCKNTIYARKCYADRESKKNGFEVHKRINIGTEKELQIKLNQKLALIFEDCGSKSYQLFLTCCDVESPNFRDKIATICGYKANRLGSIKPLHYKRLKQILIERGAIQVKGQEADDKLAMLQMQMFQQRGDYEKTIICTIDKDLMTVPGYHYNFNSRIITFVDEQEAMKNFYKQILTGDPADNIPGIAKILKIRGKEEEGENLIRHKYISKYTKLSVDFTAEKCYNYVFGMYEGFDLVDEFYEVADLLWLRRYEGQIWSVDKKKELGNV